MRCLSDHDFTRLDFRSKEAFSGIQRKINELSHMSVLVALMWKLLLAPLWLSHAVSRPKIKVRNVNKRIHSFLKSSVYDPFCIRTIFPFIYNSLARVVILNETRINRAGSDWQVLRNELNKASKLGYTTTLYEDEEAVSLLDELFLNHQRRSFRNESRYSGDLEDMHLIVCAGRNKEDDIIAVSAAWVSASYAILIYYFSIEKLQIRWLVNEELIQAAYKRGVRVFHTDNLLDTPTGSYIYQQKCGYQTVRLRLY